MKNDDVHSRNGRMFLEGSILMNRPNARLPLKSRSYITSPIAVGEQNTHCVIQIRARILVKVTIHRRLLIGRDGRLDQSEAYDVS